MDCSSVSSGLHVVDKPRSKSKEMYITLISVLTKYYCFKVNKRTETERQKYKRKPNRIEHFRKNMLIYFSDFYPTLLETIITRYIHGIVCSVYCPVLSRETMSIAFSCVYGLCAVSSLICRFPVVFLTTFVFISTLDQVWPPTCDPIINPTGFILIYFCR